MIFLLNETDNQVQEIAQRIPTVTQTLASTVSQLENVVFMILIIAMRIIVGGVMVIVILITALGT